MCPHRGPAFPRWNRLSYTLTLITMFNCMRLQQGFLSPFTRGRQHFALRDRLLCFYQPHGPSLRFCSSVSGDPSNPRQLESEIYRLAGRKFNIRSHTECSKILFQELSYDTSMSWVTSNGHYSTCTEVLLKLATKGHELPAKLMEYRSMLKSRNNDRNKAKQVQRLEVEQILEDSTSNKKESSLETLYLIDASGCIFRSYYALPRLTRDDGLPVNALLGFCNVINKNILPSLLRSPGGAGAHRVLVIFDSPAKTFREEIYPDYKANRGPCPDDLSVQFPLIKEACQAFGLPMCELKGYEADDIIATYANQIVELRHNEGIANPNVTILASDKDLLQLVNDYVIVFDPIKYVSLGREQVYQKFNVYPEALTDYFALVGDPSDNIPGIPGVGPKTAVEYLKKYGTMDNLFRNVHNIKQAKKRETLEKNVPQAYLSKRLVTLERNVPVPFSVLHVPIPNFDEKVLLSFLEKQGFEDLARRVKNLLKAASLNNAKPILSEADRGELPF